MLKEYKFTAWQIMLLYMVTVMGTANFFIPAATAEAAGRDGWLSIIAHILPTFMIIFLITKLASRYPHTPFSVCLERIMGKFMGKIISFLYIFFIFVANATVLREFLSFISTTILSETPHAVNALAMLAAVGFLLRKDLSVLGKVNDVISYVFLGSFLVIFLLIVNKFQIQNIFPILEKDVVTVLKPAIVPTSWAGEVVLFLYYLPYVDDLPAASKKLYLGAVGLIFSKIVMIMAAIFVFGARQNLRLPIFSLTTTINVAEFVRNLDAIVLIAWVTGIFIKLAVFQGAALLAVRDSVKISSYRVLVIPSLFITYAWAQSMFRGTNDLNLFLLKFWPYFAFVFQIIIPAILIIISFLRGDRSDDTSNNSHSGALSSPL